jgi:hypothetical protein
MRYDAATKKPSLALPSVAYNSQPSSFKWTHVVPQAQSDKVSLPESKDVLKIIARFTAD